MINGLVRNPLLCVLAIATCAAAPPAPAPADPSTIVVTGQRTREKDLQDFVAALTPTTVGGRLSRFERAICPYATGLPPGQRDAVANRMRRVAQAAGLRTGGKGCLPNVVLVVTQDKNALLRALRQSHPGYFGELSKREIRELEATPGPAVAWQTQGPPVTARGTEMNVDPGTGLFINRTTESASRIEEGVRPQFDAAVVIVERKALDGLTVMQLGDYAAMRAFAGMDTARLSQSGTPTILKVLEAPMGSEVVASLTEWDLGFLRGLYAAPRNLRAGSQRSAISRQMIKDAGKTP